MKYILLAIALTVLAGCISPEYPFFINKDDSYSASDHIKLSSGRTFYKVYTYDDYGRTTLAEIKEVK